MVRGRVLHVVKPRGRPWNRPPTRGCPGLCAPPPASCCRAGPISTSCSSSTSMGLSLEVTGAAGFSLSALPRVGIGSTDLVPPGGSTSGGAPAPATPLDTVRRDLRPPRSRRRSSTVRTARALSVSVPPSPPAGRVRLASAGDVRTFSSFSKSSTRLASERSLMLVFLQQIPSVAGQGSRAVCTHSNSSGGDAYR